MIIKLLIIFFISLFSALLVTWLTRQAALKYRLGALPDERKVHQGFMPHMGGFGIFAGFISGILLSALLLPDIFSQLLAGQGSMLAASLLIVLLGAYDDLKGMNALQKFSAEFIIASVLIVGGFTIKIIDLPFGTSLNLGAASILITYLWLIGLMNALNLLDGLDGLAAGVSFMALTVILLHSWQTQNWLIVLLSVALLAGLLGFLKFNFHPASIFMGDTGSLFLGLILAYLSIVSFQDQSGAVRFSAPFIILAIPIGDTGIAFFRRLNKGRHPFKPDRDHLHHRLIYLGLSHRQAVYIIYLASFLYAFAAYLIIARSPFFGAIVLLILVLLSYLGLKRVGYLEAQYSKKYYGDFSVIEGKREIAPLNMQRILHKIVLAVSDMLMLNLALFLSWWLRYRSGWMPAGGQIAFEEFMITPVTLILSFGWLGLFVINDLYDLRWDVSRFDQMRHTSKVILFGVLIFFFVTIDPANVFSEGRLTLLVYAFFLLLLINGGRMLIIFLEKKFSILEYAPHKTLIVGSSAKGKKLLKDIIKNPHLLYEPVGYVTREAQDKKFYGLSFLGTYKQIPEIIRAYNVEEIIIAINERSRDEILNIVSIAENHNVVFKILPQIYDVVSGHKTAEVIGHPLIRLFPDSMRLWQWLTKRLMDILISGILMILLFPFLLLIIILQMLSGIFPPLRIENMVGKFGVRFGMLNFCTKVKDKEMQPLVGKFLYYLRIYKLPALLNVFLGQMSLVGPRPETEKMVRLLRNKIKFYNRRFQVRPGLTGWAQVKYRYEEALKYKRDQLKQDLFYLENMSLSFDLRILLRSFFIFLFKREA